MSLILAQLSAVSFNTNIFETIYILGIIDNNYATIEKHLVTVILFGTSNRFKTEDMAQSWEEAQTDEKPTILMLI